ncbi:hypothetical protein PoB_007025900 [Plakobranchus ocellatus]|uniref:Uncharacterized protein n=1 Tax=Plakobranchus ocellatus TaxID=259542 RepID=A0AAV4DIA8_9GAST|nr:hypothetical protein PoB_007025900 [Plakobranchus ocellatus]
MLLIWAVQKDAQRFCPIHQTASPGHGDFRLSGRLLGQGSGGGVRTRDRRVSADLMEDSLPTVPPTPLDRRNTSKIAIL